MVVLSMNGFLTEVLDIVRRLVCGGSYMKKGMVCSACCAECTIVKIHSTIKKSLTRSLLYIRFKKSALIGKDGHSGSQQHEIAIQRELNKRVSFFHKEFETQLQTKDSALHHAFMSANWLAKEEIANRKFTSLLELEEILGVSEIKRFAHRSQGSQRELFLLLGQALRDEMLMKVKNADSYGLMVDEATDVSVVEQLISFI